MIHCKMAYCVYSCIIAAREKLNNPADRLILKYCHLVNHFYCKTGQLKDNSKIIILKATIYKDAL